MRPMGIGQLPETTDMEKYEVNHSDKDMAALQLFHEGFARGIAGAPDVQQLGGDKAPPTPFVVLPHNCRVESLAHLSDPEKNYSHEFTDIESFVDFVNAYQDERTRLYGLTAEGSFLAIIDDHRPDRDEFALSPKKQTARLKLEKTSEAKSWLDGQNRELSQVAFALFVEDNVHSVVKPSGADFLQVALTLQAKKGVNFRSGHRLENGDIQLRYPG